MQWKGFRVSDESRYSPHNGETNQYLEVTNTSSFRSYEFQRRIVIFNHLELLESRGCATTPVFAVDIPVYSLPPLGMLWTFGHSKFYKINILRISK
ncbi:hypothetical protein K439DRAFT_1137399 [Ramaria rubella]|nr:hypothetical protein K439DRAFT_1137399 [Ramaria rubella]